MAEEIVTSPEESVSMEAPIVESPVDIQEEVVDVEPTPPANTDGANNLMKLHKILAADELYSRIVPADFKEFLSNYSDPSKLQKLHKILAADELYGRIMPSDINEAADKYGFGGLGKPSAVPSASVVGGSATKGRGVEQPSTLQPRSSEASLDNIQQTMKVYADGQGVFPETLSAADVKELRKQVAGGELPNVSDEKVAKMLAGKSQKQVRIASINAIPDIKERNTEQARMYRDFAREKSVENAQLNQNITALTQGLEQIKAEGENLQQQLQNPNIDPQTASMLSESLQQSQANYNQAANDYNNELNKYQQNARFIKTMGAGVESILKGDLLSNMFMPRSPADVMAASAFNSTAPALLKTLGAIIDIFPSMVYGEDAKDSNSPVADALFNIADKITIDIGKYNPQANVSLMDDVNAANASQLFGSLLGSVAMTFGGGAVAGATGSQIAGFSQVYGDVYKQGKDAGLTQAEAMYFALPTGLVAAYFGDKGVESLAGVFAKTSLKSAIKQGVKELAEERTPQMMMEFGKKVLVNTLEGSGKEGLQEGAEFATEFGSKKLASLKEGVKFQDDLTFKGFKKGLAENVIGGAAGGGLLGPFFGAGRNRAFSDVVNKAARDPQAEADFIEQVNASVVANDITQEQQQQILEMLEKTKQAASTVPPVVESEPARAEATALVLEQQDLQEQIEQTNPAMAKPLNDRLDEVNNRLGEIAEGKNLPTPPAEQAPTERTMKTLADDINAKYDTEKAAIAATPQTLPEVTNEIANLREQEQAENDAIDPNDEVAKKEIYDRYDEVITPLLEQEKELKAEEAQTPVVAEAKEQEKGEFSIQGTFRGLTQVLGDPANALADSQDKRNVTEPMVSETVQNGKKFFTLTVPQSDDVGRAGYLSVSLVLPETTSKTIDDVKDALDKKVAEAQTVIETARDKGYNAGSVLKNKVSVEYAEEEQAADQSLKETPKAETKVDGNNVGGEVKWNNTGTEFKDNKFSKEGKTFSVKAGWNRFNKDLSISVLDENGDKVSVAEFKQDTDGKFYSEGTGTIDGSFTNKDFRGKGIMKSVYDFVDKNYGEVKPSKNLTNDGLGFWESNRKQSLKEQPQAQTPVVAEAKEKKKPLTSREIDIKRQELKEKKLEAKRRIARALESFSDDTELAIEEYNNAKKAEDDFVAELEKVKAKKRLDSLIEDEKESYENDSRYEYKELFEQDPRLAALQAIKDMLDFVKSDSYIESYTNLGIFDVKKSQEDSIKRNEEYIADLEADLKENPPKEKAKKETKKSEEKIFTYDKDGNIVEATVIAKGKNTTSVSIDGKQTIRVNTELFNNKQDAQTRLSETEETPTSEQAPQAFPAQEGAESVEDKFQANSELEQIYRDLNKAVMANVDKDTIRILKANPTEAMVNKVMETLKKKGVIKIDCK